MALWPRGKAIVPRELLAIVRVYWEGDKAARWRLVTVGLLAVADLSSLLVLPLISARIIDGLSRGSRSQFWHQLWLAAAVTACRMPIAYVLGVVILQVNEATGAALRAKCASAVVSAPLESQERADVGDQIARVINDTAVVRSVPATVFVQPLADIASLVVLVVIMVRLDDRLSGLLLVSLPLSFVVRGLSQGALQQRAREAREAVSRLTTRMMVWLAKPVETRAYSVQPVATSAIVRASADYQRAAVRCGRLSVAVGAINAGVVSLPNIVVFAYGGLSVLDGAITLGDLVAFLAYAGYSAGPLQRLVALWGTTIPGLLPSAQRLVLLWSQAGTNHEAEVSGVGRGVTVSDAELSRRHSPESPLWTLEVPSFCAADGETTLVTGNNGVGKSTFLRMIAGLYSPTRGAITRIDDTGSDSRTNRVHLLPQSPSLLEGTILDNLTLFEPEPDLERLKTITSVLGVDALVRTLSDGLGTICDSRLVNQLSGGQVRLIALGRAFYTRATVLCLDEPFASLDRESVSRVAQMIAHESTRRAVVVAVHHEQGVLEPFRSYKLRPLSSGAILEGPISDECGRDVVPHGGVRA